MPAFSTANMLGANLGITYAPISASTPETPGLPFALGQQTEGTDGSLWMFVVATGGNIAQYDFVGIDENFVAQPLNQTMAAAGFRIGVAQVAIPSTYYGWVCVRGANVLGKVREGCLADVALYISGTAGALDDAAYSSTWAKIDGVVAVATNSDGTAATAVEVLMTWPRSNAI